MVKYIGYNKENLAKISEEGVTGSRSRPKPVVAVHPCRSTETPGPISAVSFPL